MTNKRKSTHTNLTPGTTEKTADFLAQKRREQNYKSAQQEYPVEDKRKEMRREYTHGSTPRRDQ